MKKQIRSIYKNRRKALSLEKVEENSEKIVKHISSFIEKIEKSKKIKNIGIFMPIQNEVNLLNLLTQKNFQNKKFFLPKTINIKKREMKFCEIDKSKNIQNQLIRGNFGILEPSDTFFFEKNLDIVFTPLIGFDENFNRLGFGGGFYDTYFFKFNECIKIGIAHHVQKIEENTDFFDKEETNVKLDFIVTEQKVFGDFL